MGRTGPRGRGGCASSHPRRSGGVGRARPSGPRPHGPDPGPQSNGGAARRLCRAATAGTLAAAAVAMNATRATPVAKGGASSDFDVIVTTHNDGPGWREIADRLSTLDIHRLVIVDEGSTDVETKEVLGQLEAQGHQVVRQDHRGTSQARNLGLRISTAPFLVFVDVDTAPDDGFLAAASARMIDEASIGVVSADGRSVDTDDPIDVGEYQPSTMVTDFGFEPFALRRRAAVESVGGWDEQLETSQDRDLFLTLTEAGWGFTKLGSIGFTRALRPAPPLPSAGRVADEVRVADKH